MGSATYHLSVGAARANALFASALQRSDEPSAAEVRRAIAATVRAFGTRGCAARVAQAYGEHPENAMVRMCWARAAVAPASGGAYPASAPTPGAGPIYRSGICRAA